MIFFIRFITATCLFAFLGKANVWLNPLSNIVLAIGYRLFLVLSPMFVRISGKYAIAFALFVSAMGTILLCVRQYYVVLVGAALVGIGFSVSGYLIKFEASETPAGAGLNKIALNMGSLFSGIVLLLTFFSKELFFSIAAILLLVIAGVSFFLNKKNQNVRILSPKSCGLKKNIGWSLIGVAIGIKLFGVLSVLPQYILSYKSSLPYWYGIILFINSGIIILFQLPIIHWVAKFQINNIAIKLTLLIMVFGMILITVPQLFYAYTLTGALFWTFLLSIVECFASYLDVEASKAGYLFVKEVSVGFGAGLTVFLSRCLPANFSSAAVGVVGVVIILVAMIFLYGDLFVIKKKNMVRV